MSDERTNASVMAVASSKIHRFSKTPRTRIRLLAGCGVHGDAHCGMSVKHRAQVVRNPNEPNLRQVHLIQSELFEELAERGFRIQPGDIGENITTVGIDLLSLPRDTALAIGATAVLRLTGLRSPCSQLDTYQPGLKLAVLDRDAEGRLTRKAGVMAIVVTGGTVGAGDRIRAILPEEPHLRLERV